MTNSKQTLVRRSVLASATLLITVVAVVDHGAAAVTEKALATTCTAPVVGATQATNHLTIDVPDTAKVGEAITPKVNFTATIAAAQLNLLKNVLGADGLDFTETSHDTLSGAATGEAKGTMTVKGFTAPADGGDAQVSGQVVYDPITPTAAGTLTLTAGNSETQVTPLKGGQPTNLGTITTPCTLDAGQDATLFAIPIT